MKPQATPASCQISTVNFRAQPFPCALRCAGHVQARRGGNARAAKRHFCVPDVKQKTFRVLCVCGSTSVAGAVSMERRQPTLRLQALPGLHKLRPHRLLPKAVSTGVAVSTGLFQALPGRTKCVTASEPMRRRSGLLH